MSIDRLHLNPIDNCRVSKTTYGKGRKEANRYKGILQSMLALIPNIASQAALTPILPQAETHQLTASFHRGYMTTLRANSL